LKASFFLARKYFLSKKKQNFINILSWIGLSGVALGSASLVIVLSVFNGLEALLRSLFSSFDPDLKIELVEGKIFYEKDIDIRGVLEIEGLSGFASVLEDNALIQYRNNHSVVILKGVSRDFSRLSKLEEKVVEGNMKMNDNGIDFAFIGRGVQYKLSIPYNEKHYPMRILYPKNLKSVRLNPEKALKRKDILPCGTFAIEEHFDNNFVLVPLQFAQELFGSPGALSSLDLYIDEGADVNMVAEKLRSRLPDNFKLSTRDEQHLALFRAINIEKLFVNLAFIFLLLIISFNIFFALSMLALEKKKDLGMLAALGAGPKTIYNIFLLEGLFIGGTGVFLGLALGFGLGYLQEYHGLVSMGIENSVADAYPLKMEWKDFVISGIVVFMITGLSAFSPAKSASNFSRQNVINIF
jgi:lipoprotein-releasing system permease protein